MADTPGQLIDKLLERGTQVKLGAGVVGKTTRAMMLMIALWGTIVWKLGPNMGLNSILVGIGVFSSVLFGVWVIATHRFAERNPAQAMLENAEFLEYKKFEVAIKGGADPTTLLEQGDITPKGLVK